MTTATALHRQTHYFDNNDGWRLALHEVAPSAPGAASAACIIVPGYGMNSHIFDFHPRTDSFAATLASSGFRVFCLDMRHQGAARRDERYQESSVSQTATHTLGDLALRDLPRAVDAVCALTGAARVHLIGASLGGTLALAYGAVVGEEKIASYVLMGSPIRWVQVHPLFRAAFASPALVRRIQVRGARRLASLALPPLVKLAPRALSMYINPHVTDLSNPDPLLLTVEDPVATVNAHIARWVRQKDLILDHVNVTHALSTLERPLFCVVASGDGIVPLATARFAYENWRGARRDLLQAGGPGRHYGHADLFIASDAQQQVFEPVGNWLLETSRSSSAEVDSTRLRAKGAPR